MFIGGRLTVLNVANNVFNELGKVGYSDTGSENCFVKYTYKSSSVQDVDHDGEIQVDR
jgi:hypothetical protein